jgi:tetratricopeptide (TPR) repeat protein
VAGLQSGGIAAPLRRSNSGVPDLASDRVAMGRKHLEEAGACYDKAMAFAPGEADIYRQRGLHRTLQNYLLDQIREAAGEQKLQTEVLSDYFSMESLADLRQASALNPRDFHLIGNLALYEIYGINARTGRKGLGGEFGWATLPDGSQQSLRSAITRLENLSQDSDAKVAAGALEMLGILQGPILHESSSCVANLQRALALDPSREQAWELASGMLAKQGNYQDLLSLCEGRLKQKDSTRGHVLMAKAYEKLARWEEAEEEIVMALKAAPNDFTANLSLAALLLKRSDTPEILGEAGTWLQRCDKILSDLPPQQKNRQQVIEYSLTQGIFLALSDEVEMARKWISTVQDTDADNALAKEILSAMDY